MPAAVLYAKYLYTSVNLVPRLGQHGLLCTASSHSSRHPHILLAQLTTPELSWQAHQLFSCLLIFHWLSSRYEMMHCLLCTHGCKHKHTTSFKTSHQMRRPPSQKLKLLLLTSSALKIYKAAGVCGICPEMIKYGVNKWPDNATGSHLQCVA